MKSFNVLILCLLLAIFTGYGCMGGGGGTTTPQPSGDATKGPTVAEAPKETPAAVAFPPLDIPQAKKVDEKTKAEVDALVKDLLEKKDWSVLEKLEKLCETKKGDIALYAYLLQNSDPSVSMKGLNALKDCEDKAKQPEVYEVFKFAIQHPSDYVRSWGLDELDDIAQTDPQKEEVKQIVIKAFDDPSSHVRKECISYFFYKTDDKSCQDKIKEMMKNDKGEQVIGTSIETLDGMDVDIKEDLLNFIETGTPYVKSTAMYVISQEKYKDLHKELIPKFVKMLDDKTETYVTIEYDNGDPMTYNTYAGTIREMAVMCLEKMTGEKFKGKDDNDVDGVVKKWKEWATKKGIK